MEIGEPRQLVVTCPNCGDNKLIMARQVKKEDVETNPAFIMKHPSLDIVYMTTEVIDDTGSEVLTGTLDR